MPHDRPHTVHESALASGLAYRSALERDSAHVCAIAFPTDPIALRGAPLAGVGSRKRRNGPAGTNRRGRAPKLTEQDVVAAALALLQASGVAGISVLSVRAVARQLGVSATAVHHHVANKQDLLERVAETLLATVPTPEPSPAAWEAQLRDYALAIWERVSSQPGLSRFLSQQPPVEALGRVNFYAQSLLCAGGFDEPSALMAALSFGTYLGGALGWQARVGGRAGRSDKAKANGKPVRSQPQTDAQRLFDQTPQVSARARLELGLDTLLSGLRARRAEQRATAAPRRTAPAQRQARTRSN